MCWWSLDLKFWKISDNISKIVHHKSCKLTTVKLLLIYTSSLLPPHLCLSKNSPPATDWVLETPLPMYRERRCCCYRVERLTRHGAGRALSGPSSGDTAWTRAVGRRRKAATSSRWRPFTGHHGPAGWPTQPVRPSSAHPAGSQDR